MSRIYDDGIEPFIFINVIYQLRSAGVCQSMSALQALNPSGSDRNPKAYSGCHLLSSDWMLLIRTTTLLPPAHFHMWVNYKSLPQTFSHMRRADYLHAHIDSKIFYIQVEAASAWAHRQAYFIQKFNNNSEMHIRTRIRTDIHECEDLLLFSH